MKIEAIYRYPFKGLSAEPLDQATLETGQGIALDRAFALALARAPFDPAAPRHLEKTNFLMLMRHQRLAALTARYDETANQLTIAIDGREQLAANPDTAEGRSEIESFFTEYCRAELGENGPVRLVSAQGHMFSDVPDKCLSLVNLASVRALEEAVGDDIDPLRFRANIYFSGADPWAEMDWAGKTLCVGGVRLTGIKPITRCAATNVNPRSAQRDANIPKCLKKEFGHICMGQYAATARGGIIKAGNDIELVQ